MRKKFITCLVLGVLVLVGTAWAQEAEDDGPVYTRVASWAVNRAQWDAFVEDYKAHDMKVMQELFDNGVVVEFGLDTETLHGSDGWTHHSWYSTRSMADMARVDAAWESYLNAMTPSDKQQVNANFASMIDKHEDSLSRGVVAHYSDSNADGSYYYSWSVKVNPGSGDDFRTYFDEYNGKVMKQLMGDGALISYGLSVQEISTVTPGRRTVWAQLPDLAAYDKLSAAMRASWGEMSDEQGRARWAGIRDIIETGSFRESLSNSIVFRQRAHHND
ncbi:MAG: hypothetical protein OEM62_11335 [Acidobacteriota bacterium]|nr:hypothetical protein [Acidobacteriota bacterium]